MGVKSMRSMFSWPKFEQKYETINQPNICSTCSQQLADESKHHKHKYLKNAGRVFIVTSSILWIVLAWKALEHYSFQNNSGLQSDKLFGDIPTRYLTWDEEADFVQTDPLDGKWDYEVPRNSSTAWDSLYRGAWIQLPNPSRAGVSGGLPLSNFSKEGIWKQENEGFVVSVLHQLHCVGLLKHAITETRHGQCKPSAFEHTEHCVEYLRQAVMCHADLSLEKPAHIGHTGFHGSTGWGSQHYCRDWSIINQFFTEHRIMFERDEEDRRLKVYPWQETEGL